MEAEKEVTGLLSGKVGLNINTVSGSGVHFRADYERRCLNVAESKMSGLQSIAVLDSGPLKRFPSFLAGKAIASNPTRDGQEQRSRDRCALSCRSVLKQVPVTFRESTARLNFLEVFPSEIIFGDPNMEDMRGVLDLGRHQSHFTIDGDKGIIPVSYNCR